MLAFNARLPQTLQNPIITQRRKATPKANLQFLGQIQVINLDIKAPLNQTYVFWILVNQYFSKTPL